MQCVRSLSRELITLRLVGEENKMSSLLGLNILSALFSNKPRIHLSQLDRENTLHIHTKPQPLGVQMRDRTLKRSEFNGSMSSQNYVCP
jgi:hypothetical protein